MKMNSTSTWEALSQIRGILIGRQRKSMHRSSSCGIDSAAGKMTIALNVLMMV